MKRVVVYKKNKFVYFYMINIRKNYFKAKLQNKKITNKLRISKKQFYKEINRLKST